MTPTDLETLRTAMRWLSTEEKAALIALLAEYEAAEKISRIYFEIAADAIGEDEARKQFKERFDALRATLSEGERG